MRLYQIIIQLRLEIELFGLNNDLDFTIQKGKKDDMTKLSCIHYMKNSSVGVGTGKCM